MEEIEIWKDVEGYEGLYQVSDLGRIKSLPKIWFTGKGYSIRVIKEETILSSCINGQGYPQVVLCKNGYKKNKLVHILVATHYVSNAENKPEVNHVDGNKANPKSNNLQWCTSSENKIHAYRTGLTKIKKGKDSHMYGKCKELHPLYGKIGSQHPKSKLVLDTQTGIFYESLSEAANAKGYDHRTLSAYLLGKYRNKTGLIYA